MSSDAAISLFDSFGVGIDTPSITDMEASKARAIRPRPLSSIERASSLQKTLSDLISGRHSSVVSHEVLSKLNRTTIQKMAESFNKTGSLTLICMRCGRKHTQDEIGTSLVIDPSGFSYGVQCSKTIKLRQDLRKMGFNSRGDVVPVDPALLITSTCMTTGTVFEVNPELSNLCGTNPSCCGACPHSQVKYKHLPCPMEEKLELFVNTYPRFKRRKNF